MTGEVAETFVELSGELLELRGPALLDSIVETLATRLGFDVALVGELSADKASVYTTAAFAHGAPLPPVVYPLAGSPCEEATTSGLCAIPSGVAARFPTDAMLDDLRAESYVGIPVTAMDGSLLGILAVVGPPIDQATCELAEQVLRLAAGRCAHELHRRVSDRRQAEQAQLLREQLAHLQLQSRVSTRLLEATDFDAAIAAVMRDVCETIGVGRASISEQRADGAFEVTFSSPAPGLPSNLGQTPDRTFPWYWRQLTSSPVFIASDLPLTLPPEAEAERRYCEANGVRGVLAVPLFAEGAFVSSFGVHDFKRRIWTEGEVRAVRGVGELILGALLRKRSADQRARLEAQLARAEKLEALGTLASGIAHDFNNMLMGIRGSVEIVAAQLPVGSPHATKLADALQATERAAELTREILLFARTRPAPDPERVELGPTIQSAVTLLRRTVPAKIAIEARITAEPLAVQADPTHLYQIIVNLGTNAFHAIGGAATGRIDVVVERDADVAVIRVRDDGVGMDPAVQARVFDPFFTTKAAGEGTGLGLSVVHSIVQSCGGRVELESAPGAGTEVRVRLPLCDPPPRARASAAHPHPRGAGERIFLVDDEPLVLRAITQLLEYLGYVVMEFTSPQRALDAIIAEPGRIDLLITDHTMPEMSGDALIKAVGRCRAEVPAILCTGVAASDALDQLTSGPVLPKPVSLQRLAEVVRRALDGRPTA